MVGGENDRGEGERRIYSEIGNEKWSELKAIHLNTRMLSQYSRAHVYNGDVMSSR